MHVKLGIRARLRLPVAEWRRLVEVVDRAGGAIKVGTGASVDVYEAAERRTDQPHDDEGNA